jgi:predicted N-acetyltransferase YhbS
MIMTCKIVSGVLINGFMNITIRQAREVDFKETENLTREAFWYLYKPGSDEHLVLHKIRESISYIGELDLILALDRKIIGHIICTKARVVDSMNQDHLLLCAGPFSIMNEYQGKGYGSDLMEYCIEKSKELGYVAIILFGNPLYYHRFGFRNAAEFGISTKEGLNFDPFMVKELIAGGLKEIRGKFYEDDSFLVDLDELNEFEKKFPFKEKHVTDTQLKM